MTKLVDQLYNTTIQHTDTMYSNTIGYIAKHLQEHNYSLQLYTLFRNGICFVHLHSYLVSYIECFLERSASQYRHLPILIIITKPHR